MNKSINKDGLLSLYSYNIYANNHLLNTVENLSEAQFTQAISPSHSSVQGLISHMLECEAFFLNQCQGNLVELDLSNLTSLPSIRKYWSKLEQEQLEFIRLLNDTEIMRDISVKLSDKPLILPIWQLLTQALIHFIHHRGELSIVLTELNHPLPTLDIILHFIKEMDRVGHDCATLWLPNTVLMNSFVHSRENGGIPSCAGARGRLDSLPTKRLGSGFGLFPFRERFSSLSPPVPFTGCYTNASR